MTPTGAASVITRDGRRGTLEETSDHPNGAGHRVVHLEDGQELVVPEGLLAEQDDGSYHLPVDVRQVQEMTSHSGSELIVIPVLAEEIDVQARRVETGRVRVEKQVHEREIVVDEPGYKEEVRVERVPVHRAVSEPPSVRYEGETMVIPLVEEVLVVEKRLMVREELRVTKVRKELRSPQRVTVRSEEAVIERHDTESGDATADESE